jgi:hypothetical protein
MEDVKAILIEAARAVEDAKLKPDLRQAGFEKAIDLLAQAAGRQPAAPRPPAPGVGDPIANDDDPLGKIAARLNVDVEVVREVYHVEGDKFEVVVAVARLEAGMSPATKQIALLIPAARQAAGIEEWTSVDHIRKVSVDYGRYDSANFASAVRETAGLQFRQENRKTMDRVTRPGFEAATALVRRLAGVES